MSIPPRFLEELRSRVTLSEVVGKNVRLTRAGQEFKGCCPFHNERTPSFFVNDDKQFYHCFGCGAHGSVFDFVMNTENYSFIEAVEALALRAGMQVPKSSPQEIERSKQEKSLYSLMDAAARFMEKALHDPSARAACDYVVQERGLSLEILSAFRIGFAPPDRQVLRKFLKGEGYTDAQMIECGILRVSDNSQEPYAFFRDRLMFPVMDRRGRIVAFGGRILPDHLRSPGRGDFTPPKYINSSDTPLFHKGRMLYGEPQARQAAIDGHSLVVVEGYLDVIACVRAGFRGAVAPLGTALTEDQILVLWKMIPGDSKVPVLCFDGDEAGRRAASRACERILPLLKPDHSARIAFLPQGEDPDSLIRARGAGALREILDNALNMVDFLWSEQVEARSFVTPEERAGLSKSLEDLAGRIADRTVQHYYRDAFRAKVRAAFAPQTSSNRTRGGYDSGGGYGAGAYGRGSYGAYGAGSGARRGAEALLPVTRLSRPAFARNMLVPVALLTCVINNPAIYAEIEEEFGHLHIPENGLDRLRQAVLSTLDAYIGENPDEAEALDPQELCTHLKEQGFTEALERILSDSIYTHAGFARPQKDPLDALEGWRRVWKSLQEEAWQQDIEQAKAAFREAPDEENEMRLRALQEMRAATDG